MKTLIKSFKIKSGLAIIFFMIHGTAFAKIDSKACQRVSKNSYNVKTKNGSQNVSVLSYNQALNFFNQLKHPSFRIPYLEAENNCESRAHKIAETLYNNYNISSIKAFIRIARKEIGTNMNGSQVYSNTSLFTPFSNVTGEHYSWGYHTSVALCVRFNDKDQLFVFDHSMFKTPVTLAQWQNSVTSGLTPKDWEVYLTTMFNLWELTDMPANTDMKFRSSDTAYVNNVLNVDWQKHILKLSKTKDQSR